MAEHGVGDALGRPEVCKTGKTSSLLDFKKNTLKNANNKPDVQTKKKAISGVTLWLLIPPNLSEVFKVIFF